MLFSTTCYNVVLHPINNCCQQALFTRLLERCSHLVDSLTVVETAQTNVITVLLNCLTNQQGLNNVVGTAQINLIFQFYIVNNSEHYCFDNVDKTTCLGAFFRGEKNIEHTNFFDFVYCERRNYTLIYLFTTTHASFLRRAGAGSKSAVWNEHGYKYLTLID